MAALEALADYLEHWAHGTNFATGRTGTRIGYCGFSDWTHVGIDDKNPFSLSGLRRRQAHGMAETVEAWAGGLVWKYDYLAKRMDAQGLPRAMETGLPEAGYFDDRGGLNAAGAEIPCDVIYADHRGAALRTMRTAAYAARPRLRWAWNRYALGTGDFAHVYADKAKPPIFHAIRIERKLEGERMLPVDQIGATRDPSNDVRVIASATDAPGACYRVVAVSFNESFAAASPETLRIRLTGLGGAKSVRVTEYRIDAKHNNWWPDWKRWREANGLPLRRRREQRAVRLGHPLQAPVRSVAGRRHRHPPTRGRAQVAGQVGRIPRARRADADGEIALSR